MHLPYFYLEDVTYFSAGTKTDLAAEQQGLPEAGKLKVKRVTWI